ncbi:MAG: imidazoleglycerol-phosphate dehydratase HisB [Clostridium sp.]|nr:imidazoleglycerol-phosphate dehydratase HisB [Clostridium sp.]
MKERKVQYSRKTNETNVSVAIYLDGQGKNKIDTPIGFLNHMLTLFSFHSNIDLEIIATGDIEVCDHHIVEDIAIALGIALKEALSYKKGIKRYGTFYIAMDESLAMISLDISGRGYLCFNGNFKRESIGDFSTEMVKEFFRAIAINAAITIHCNIIYGENDHHKIEALFKAFGHALKESITIDGNSIPSSKGVIG